MMFCLQFTISMCFRVKCRWTTKSGRDGYYTGLLAVMWTLNSFLLPLSCGLMLDRSAWCSPTGPLQLLHSYSCRAALH
jgi:hypothetical protein